MTGEEQGDLFNTGDCQIEVTIWAGVTVSTFNNEHVLKFSTVD